MNRTPLLIEELKTVKRPPRILYRSCKSKSPALWKNTKIYFTVDHYTGMPLKGGVRIDSGFLMDGRFVSGQCHHFTKGFDVCQKDRKSTRLNSSHVAISYAVFCLKKKKTRHS